MVVGIVVKAADDPLCIAFPFLNSGTCGEVVEL